MEAKLKWYEMLYESDQTLEHLINTKKCRIKILKNEERRNYKAIDDIVRFTNELLWYLSTIVTVRSNIYHSLRDLLMEINMVSHDKTALNYFKELDYIDEPVDLFEGEIFIKGYDWPQQNEAIIVDHNKNPITLNRDMWDSFIRNLNDEE